MDMNESVWLVAIALVMAGALGFGAGWVVKSRKPTAGGDQTALQAQLDMAQHQYEDRGVARKMSTF